VAFSDKHDVRVVYGTGKPPELLRTVLTNAPGGVLPPGPDGGGLLRIWGLESQQPHATAGMLPRRQPDKKTN
jgi:hypothetical protein